MNEKLILNKVRSLLGLQVKLETMKLTDGVSTIEAEVFEAGQPVFILSDDEQRIALPVGEYELEDGRVLVVIEEGIIASVGTDVETPEESVSEPVEVEQKAERLPKKIIKNMIQEHHFEEQTPEDVISTVNEAEDEVIQEVVAIIDDLTPESVTEADASELANEVINAVTETLAELPEEVSMKALSKIKKYGKQRMSEEEAAVIEEAQSELVDSIASVVNEGTPEDVTPEISEEIAATIVEAVTEIVQEQPAELSAKLFRNKKKAKFSKYKRTAKKQTKLAQKPKPISFNPENTQATDVFKFASKRNASTMDSVLNRISNIK